MISKLKTTLKNKSFKELFKNSSYVMISKTLAIIMGFLTNILIARYYGAETLGIVTLINTFITIMSMLILFGTSTSILKLIPQYVVQYSVSDAYSLYKKIFKLLLLWGTFLSIFVYFLSDILEIYIFKIYNIGFYFAIVAIFIIPIALKNYTLASLRALKDMKIFAIIDFLPSLIIFIGILTFIFLYDSRFSPIFLYIIAPTIVFLISIFIVQKKFKLKLDNTTTLSSPRSTRIIIFTSFPMLLISAMHIIMANTDIIMIGIYLTEKEIGIYSVAVKIALLTSFVLHSVNLVVSPQFSRYYHSNDMLKLKESVKNSSKLIFISTFPLLIILIIFGKYILQMFGEEFMDAYIVMVILILGQIVNSLCGSVGYFLNMTGYQKDYQNIIFIGVLINIILNILLIPNIGLIGAAIATTLSLLYWNFAALIFMKKKFNFTTLYDWR